MPYRTWPILELAAGAVVVVVLFMAGIDVAAKSEKNGRFNRLVCAGLFALTLLGISLPVRAQDRKARFSPQEAERLVDRAVAKPLILHPEWTAWIEARFASLDMLMTRPRRKTTRRQRRLATELEGAICGVEELCERKILTPLETEVFRQEGLALKGEVIKRLAYLENPNRFETDELPNATRSGAAILKRLLPGLETLAASGTVRGEASEVLVPVVARLLSRLKDVDIRFRISETRHDEVRSLRERGEKALALVRRDFRPPLEDDPAWRQIDRVWAESVAILNGSGRTPRFTDRDQEKALDRLDDAKQLFGRLRHREGLTHAEKLALQIELEKLRKRIAAMPVISTRCYDGPSPTCYTPAPVPGMTPDVRIKMLKKRLPLLEDLAEQNTVRQEVLARTLKDVEKELGKLRDAYEEWAKSDVDANPLQKAQADEIEKTLKQVAGLLIKVKAK